METSIGKVWGKNRLSGKIIGKIQHKKKETATVQHLHQKQLRISILMGHKIIKYRQMAILLILHICPGREMMKNN